MAAAIETRGASAMMTMTQTILEAVKVRAEEAMRLRFGDRVIQPDDLGEISTVFADAVIKTLESHGLRLSEQQLGELICSYCNDIDFSKPGPWSQLADVVDIREARDQRTVRRGEGGFFGNCPDVPASLLIELGVGEGPFAVGLQKPSAHPGAPELEGWALKPHEARALAKALLEKADACEQGWPDA
jgi:hypothetical protein